jgi:hypothetical protein
MDWANHFHPIVLQWVMSPHRFRSVLTIFATDVLDGAMITLAIYTLNFVHPGMFLYNISSVTLTHDEKKLPETSASTLLASQTV